MIRVVAIDDHEMILNAIAAEIEKQSDMKLVGTADHGSEIHHLVREKTPNVVILDLAMGTGGPFEPVSAVQMLLREHPEVKVLILTGYDDPVWIRELIEAGALGYMLKFEKFLKELPRAIRTIYNGDRFYSPAVLTILFGSEAKPKPDLRYQEIQILRLMAEGLQNKQIGEIIGVSERRVRNILTEVYSKLNIRESEVNPRVAGINKARELGLLIEKK